MNKIYADKLKEREIDILKLISDGLSNEEIGKKLNISIPTVKLHIKNIFDKLGSVNRAHAVATALRSTLIA